MARSESGALEQDAGHFAEDVRDRDAGVEQRRDHSPKECHVGGRGEAVSGDVTDDKGQSLTIEEEPFIPVPSHRARCGWPGGTERRFQRRP